MKVYTGKHLRRPDSFFLSSSRSQVRKGAQVGAHVVEIAPTSHTRFPFPRISSPNNSTAIQKQNLTLTMTFLETVSIQTGVILIVALKFIRKLHLCNPKTGYVQLVKVHITLQTENSYSISPHNARVKPQTIIHKYYLQHKGRIVFNEYPDFYQVALLKQSQ